MITKRTIYFVAYIFGSLFFWSFGGSLTSFSATQNEDISLQNLDDLLKKPNSFKFFVIEHTAAYSLVLEWGHRSKRNEEIYENIIKPNRKFHSETAQIIKYLSENENAALLIDEPTFNVYASKRFHLNVFIV